MSWPKPSDLTDEEWDLIKPILKQYDPHTRIDEMKTDFSISSEKTKPTKINGGIFVSENPSNYCENKAIKIEVSEEFILYLSGTSITDITNSLTSGIRSILNYEHYNSESIKLSAISIFENCSTLTNDLIEAINEVFAKDFIVAENLYSPIDLKSMKVTYNVYDEIKNIDQNIKLFIKNNKIYAGLSYLKDIIVNLKYGFGVYYEKPRSEDFNKIVVYPEYIIWGFEYKGFDGHGDLISKIIEHVFALLGKTNHSDPVANLYKKLQDRNIVNFKADVLVCVIEALIKNEEKNFIEDAVSKLKKIEPTHPIIETANKALRRIQVLNQISEAFDTNIADIQKLNGVEFEIFLESQFVKNNFKVERTKGSGDFGADLIVETPSGTRASVQAKRYKQKTNLKAVQEVVASLAHYQTDFGVVITTSGFFQSAVDLAQTNNVELWDEDRLIQFLSGDFSFSMLSDS